MGVTLVAPQYETSDGKRFLTPGEAARHEKLVTAEKAYEEARRTYEAALAETQRTADGALFTWGLIEDYWVVQWPAFGPPTLERVRLYPFNCQVFLDARDRVVIRMRAGEKGEREYGIWELYHYEQNAKLELLRVTEAWLRKEQDRAAKLRAELGLPAVGAVCGEEEGSDG